LGREAEDLLREPATIPEREPTRHRETEGEEEALPV
jgi:hypothetical protein